MLLLCECDSDCVEEFEVPDEEALEIMLNRNNLTIISDNCKHGPEKTDVFVEQRQGYKVYRSGEPLVG